MLAFLLWDLGWRTGQSLPRLEAVCFTVVAVLELLHVITALDFAEAPDAAVLLRLGTWSPAAYLLPLGLLVGAATEPPQYQPGAVRRRAADRRRRPHGAVCAWCRVTARRIFSASRGPRCSSRFCCGFRCSSATGNFATRTASRRVFAIFAAITFLVPALILYSQAPADKMAIMAHFVRVAGELYLLFSLTQMGTVRHGAAHDAPNAN